MIRHELNIRYASARLRPTVAWLVPGEEVESWLRELVGWDVDLRDMTLRPIPRSRRDATASGVLVTLPDGCIPKVSARCQEYGRIARRCFLPVQARLEPGVVEADVAALLEDSTSDYIFHPATGLIIVRDEQKLNGADLLSAPRAVPGKWNRACPGEAVASRLALVEPQMRTSLEDFFREGGDDIGSQDLSSAPLSSQAARSWGRKATESGGAEKRGFLSHLVDAAKWAIQSLRGAARSIPSPRAQLDGLLRLLESDPDEGLRYAVPLTDPGRRSGTPNAGGVLARHAVDFSLKFASSGGEQSTWVVSSNQYESLQRRYRELANRELHLRRYRRAAHIFANLLGDWSSAATALVSGKHWREAALIYRDRLNSPAEAAECLEKAGMYSEAVGLYEQLNQFERVGHLFSLINQPEQAERAYRQAVAQDLAARNFLGAASLLQSRLQAPREALLILADGWPASDQAEHCLRETVRILETLNAHDETAALLRRLVSAPRSPEVVEKAVSVLVQVAHNYPDTAIQHQAADHVRVLAGGALASSHALGSPQLLRAVGKLVPADRLLQRDCQRYARLTRAEPQRARIAGKSALRLYPNWFFDLPAETTWCTAASDEQAWYFAGYGAQRLIVTRVPWLTESASLERLQWSVDTVNEQDDAPDKRRGEFEQLQWPLLPGLRGQPILLCPDPRRQTGLLIHVVGGQPLTTTTQRFRETDNIPRGQLIGTHRGFTLDTRGVARSLDGITWLATAADSVLSLATYSPEEQRLGTCELPPFLAGQLPVGPVHVLAGLTHVMLGFGNALCCLKRGVGIEMVRLPSPLRALCAAPGEYPHYSVVICDRHLAVLWHARKDNHLELLQDDVSNAVCGFTRQGRLLVVQTGRFEIYEPVKDNLQLRGSGTLPLRSPIAVLATPQPDQILVCSESGRVMRAAFA